MDNKSIPVYTIMLTLQRMKKTLGVEATLEFIDSYANACKTVNPEMAKEVENVLQDNAINALYLSTRKDR